MMYCKRGFKTKLAFFVSLFSLYSSCYWESFNHQSSQVVMNASYFSFSTESLLCCARRCKSQRKCLSINYDTIKKDCFLNFKSHISSDTQLYTSSHIRSYDISVWSDEVLFMGGCSNHSCRYDMICNEGGGDHTAPYTCTEDTQCQWNDGCTACLQESGQTIPANTPNYVAVGCYYAPNTNTGFNDYVSFRSQINWRDIGATIRACATEARNRMLLYFGIEYYGECYMRNDTLEASYRLIPWDKCEERCILGVGGEHTLFVYQLQ